MNPNLDVPDVVRRIRRQWKAQITLMLLCVLLRWPRWARYSRQRLDPDMEIETLLNENMFERTFKRSPRSFSHLLGLLSTRLEVDEQQARNYSGEDPISPCIMLMAILRYLAGGSYLDIQQTVDINQA